MLHGHGDDGYRHGRTVRVNFSSNVPPWRWPTELRRHLVRRLGAIGVYPEVAAETLTAQLARRHGVARESVLVTAGATAAIHLIAQALRGRRSCVVIPTFAEYEDACRANGHRLSFMRWENFAAGDRVRADLVWVCNPNNPTGAVLGRARLQEIARAQPGTIFVADLAYANLCDEPPVRARDAVATDNLLLVHSLTKCVGVPGLRLGYVTGPRTLLEPVRSCVAPWAVNTLALAAGEFAVSRRTPGREDQARYLATARRLEAALGRVAGVRVEPSRTGFVLIRLEHGTGAELKAWLLRRHGFLVRDAGNFRGLDERCVRIAAQRPAENRALVRAVEQWMRGR